MTEHQDSQNFADLFKRYRLRSQIDTLSHFGDLFAEEGMIYENSLFTRWQNGQRIPRDRRTILSLIRLFVKKGGIVSLEEANGLLKVVGLCDLSEEEASLIPIIANKQNTFNKLEEYRFDSQQNLGQKLTKNDSHIEPITLKELWRSNFTRILLILFIFNTFWYARIQLNQLQNSFESYMWGQFYSIIPLSGFMYYIHIWKKSSRKKFENGNRWQRVMKYFAIGLFSQWVGLTVWTYYNLTGTQVPYPSIADIGYLSTAYFYLLASKNIFTANFFETEVVIDDKKSYLFAIPLIVLFSFCVNYLYTFNLSLGEQVKILLDFAYPLLEAAGIFVVLCGMVFSNLKNRGILQRNGLLLFALTSHFITEYLFVLSVQTNNYFNGGYNDFLYMTSYILMCLSLVLIRPLLTTSPSLRKNEIRRSITLGDLKIILMPFGKILSK